MSVRCIKIILLLFFVTQSTLAQLSTHFRNGGYKNLPVPKISQNYNNHPVGNNFPVVNNIPFMNLPVSGNAPTNVLQKIPKLSFIGGQVGDLINFATNINNKQLAANNPSAAANSLIDNNNLQSNSLPVYNFTPNNPYLPMDSIHPVNNFNNVPNNFVPTANGVQGYAANAYQYLPENNVPFQNALSSPTKINSLTLAGQPFNNGIPFNVVPADYNSGNSFPFNNYVNYNEVNTGLKFPRSLPANDVTETGYYPVANSNGFPVASIIENNGIACQSPNDAHTANMVANNILSNELSVNNGMPVNVIPNQFPVYNQETFSPNAGCGTSTVATTGEVPNNFLVNFNNIPTNNDQIVPNNYQTPCKTESQPLKIIPNYQNNDNKLTNWPANNVGQNKISQPNGDSFNLANLSNNNMLSLGELGNFPIFSGLPIIGITETVSVINPDQVNQILAAGS